MKKITLLLCTLFFIAFSGSTSSAQNVMSFGVPTYDFCGTVRVVAITDSCAPGQTMTLQYGDGTSETLPVSCLSSGVVSTLHPYSSLGIYTAKAILNAPSPVDSAVFSVVNAMCGWLTIGAYVDNNGNCLMDAGDYPCWGAADVEVDSAGIPVDTLSLACMTWYRGLGPAGTLYAYRLLNDPPGLALSCPSSGIIYDTLHAYTTSTLIKKYFAFHCTSSSSSFDLDVDASFRPTVFQANSMVTVTNTSCTGTPALLKVDYSPKYTLDTIYPACSYTVTGSSALIDIGTVGIVPKRFYMTYSPSTTLVVGDTVNTTFTVTPVTGDVNAANNVLARCDTIRGAWDPNHKSVTPTGNIMAGTRLEYMIEFENTGTDTAHNIHILDTLSENLDFSSFRPGVASHERTAGIYTDGPYHILKFDFPNIMLPDSSHHDVCRGFATFTINSRAALPGGTVIGNRAGIYFDFNEAVLTNMVYSNTFANTGIGNTSLAKVELYPNPVRDMLTISADNNSYSSVSIFNVLGQQLQTQEALKWPLTFNVESLVPGLYYAVLKGSSGVRAIKFEKK